jgi:hypothetical protein
MPTPAPAASRFSFGRFLLWVGLIVVALAALYFAVVLNWSYSSGERAGWVQKFSKKGWLCKTWEGEIVLVSMPGAIPEKFEFTVYDDEVADQINRVMGQRVALHYEQRVGLPTSCFGDTRYFVTRVVRVEEAPLTPGGAPPLPNGGFAPTSPPASAPTPVPTPAPDAVDPATSAPGTSAPGTSAPGTAPVSPPALPSAAPNSSGELPASVPGLPASGSGVPATPPAPAPASPAPSSATGPATGPATTR